MIAYEQASPAILEQRDQIDHRIMFDDLQMPILEDTEINDLLPYAPAFRSYTHHVGTCPECQDADALSLGCPEGAYRARRAADAMNTQEQRAELN